jgi:cytochrome c5
MLEVNHDSLRYLTHSDQLAIATYLKTVESKTPPIPKSSGGAGGGVYEAYCTGCHTTGAGGAPKLGDAAAWDPLLKAGIDSVYASAINGKGGMPAKGTCLSCSDTEIKQAVDYMVAATKGEAGKTVVAAPLPKPLTLADGKRLYDENCSICHNAGFKGAPKPGDTAAWLPIIKAGFMQTYINVVSGRLGHPPMGACTNCNDAELKAAIKYMMQQSTTTKNYELW